MFNTSISLFIPSYQHCDIDLRVSTSQVIGLDAEWPQMNEVFLWGAFHEMPLDYLAPHTRPLSSVWVIQGRRTRTNAGPWVTRELSVCWDTFLSCGASIFFFMSFIHPLIAHFFCFLCPVPSLIALAQVLNYFQYPAVPWLPGKVLQGHKGPFGLTTLKNSWFETTTAHPDDSMIWLFSAWSSFLFFALFPSEWLSFPLTTDIDLSLSLLAPGLPCLKLLTPDH